MIAASEPLEFVPHGRTVLAKHPGQIYGKGRNTSASENLLHKLDNVAIKDESLLEAREYNDTEWWCIREVYYRSDATINKQSESPKDTKFEYTDSFRPPSGLKTDFNTSIKSELMGGKKDDAGSAGTSRAGSANSSSNMSRKFNLNSGESKGPKIKPLNPKTDCFYEEELYVKGCTAVWSKGSISTPATKLSGAEHRETISCYTIDNPIKHAAFANFHVSINNTMLIDALNSQIGDVKKNIKIEDATEHIATEVMPSILLIDNKCMKVFTIDGREFITNIPFQVKKVWPMKYGVLLEKDATPALHNSMFPASFQKLNDSHNSTFTRPVPANMSAKLRAESIYGQDHEYPLPTCFSLSHPLDEVTPVLMKSASQGLQYYNDGNLQIIFVSTDPSIIFIYDWKLGTHSLWKIRTALRDECLTMCPNLNCSTVFNQSCDVAGSPMHNIGRNATSWIGSPFQSRRAPTTPTRSRQDSPMANVFHQQGLSPHSSIGQASCANMMANTTAAAPPSLPLYPVICLDHIWTDTQVIRRDQDGLNDFKTFLHTDLVGHDFLCFMVKVAGVNKLHIMRLQKSHAHGQSTKTKLMVGAVSTVPAKDAVVLDHLKMFALIDESGNIILHSGNYVVGKVHVGGVLARLIDSPYTKRSSFQSPFPRRSSLLPSRSDTATLDDSALHLLSPVPHSTATRVDRESLGLRGLCDAAGSRVTLAFETGQLYRIELPTLTCSSLVNRCCTALQVTLPKDVTMQILIKWYGVRNAPGTQDLTPEQEWGMFTNVLFSLIGYDMEKLNRVTDEEHEEVVKKKQRTSSDGSQDDWQYLLNSKLHKSIGGTLAKLLNLNPTQADPKSCKTNKTKDKVNMEKPVQFNKKSLLLPYTLQLFYSFHLLYEDIKLNTLLYADLKLLSLFQHQVAKDLRLREYVKHYWLDFPTDYPLEFDEDDSQMTENVLMRVHQPIYYFRRPPGIFNYLNSVFMDLDVGFFQYLPEVNTRTRDIIEVLATAGLGVEPRTHTINSHDTISSSTPRSQAESLQAPTEAAEAVLEAWERGITPRDIDHLPPAIALAMLTIFTSCKSEPPPQWPREAYNLVMREDLALQTEVANKIKTTSEYMETLALEVLEKETVYTLVNTPVIGEALPKVVDEGDANTGMEHLKTKLLKLLYPMDHRMSEVFRLLQSSNPVTINLTQRPEVSDHDFIEEQEKHLYAIGTRTMALPVARGMLTLRSLPCSETEPVHLPKLCVSGRGPPPRCNTITLGGGDTSPHCLVWPTFHNGVAAGLALIPMTGSSIDPSWIIYNKPRGDLSTEHAGFLLGLGLNGHLKNMPFMNMYEYLIKCNEMISVGLLLGLGATYRGTMDVQATKMMSIHLEPLLPPTSIELDIQQNILVAALLALGLLYQGTGHAHYAQVLLNEIGKPPGPEMENCVEREGYALAAGLALGMVCLQTASGTPHLERLAPRLRTYMLGGDRKGFTGSQKEKYKQGSFAIREGATVNLDVTSPGATVALGLIYMKSNNPALAEWLEPPTTAYLLDFVRPDLLMLRVISRGLVLWDSIEASEEWIENQVPWTIKPYCFVKPTEENIDYEAMNQAYCNIIAGASFVLGLRFAGSGDEDARDAVLHFADMFLSVGGKGLAELAGGSTLESCLCVCLLAAGMIMAGRGDISVLRICRRLRARIPTPPRSSPPALTHGGQMAVHCTMGLLFLGGGRSTLSSTPAAVAALLAAFFPKFPIHSEDNRYHLQAFRHLYVLAVESRLILPRDLDTGKLCYAHIQIIDLEGIVKEMKAPCIIPELSGLREVKINDPRYWPITFHRDHNWDQLKLFLDYTWCIDIKQRAGCLSYLDDPLGFLTIMAQTLTLDKANIWSVTPDNIQLFSNDEKVKDFVKHYLAKDTNVASDVCANCLTISKKRKGVKNEVVMPKSCICRQYSKEEQEYVQSLSMVTYECVVKDTLCALPIWTTFLKILRSMKTEPTSYQVWQIRMLLSQLDSHHKNDSTEEMSVDGDEQNSEPLISTEFTLAIKQKAAAIFDACEAKIAPYLRKYLGMRSRRKINAADDHVKKMLAAFLVYHNVPQDVLENSAGEEASSVFFASALMAQLGPSAAAVAIALHK